jgi:hypothetical protein
MTYNCYRCNIYYDTSSGLYKHNKNYHKDDQPKEKKINNKCEYCGKELSNYKSKWRHEKSCIKKNYDVVKMREEIENLKSVVIKLKTNEPHKINNNLNGKNKILIHNSKEKTTCLSIANIECYTNLKNTIPNQRSEFNCLESTLSSAITLDNEHEFYINGISIKTNEDNFIDATIISSALNINFNDWYALDTTKKFINDFVVHTKLSINSLINFNKSQILLHPEIAIQFVKWISPIYGLKLSNWLKIKQTNKRYKRNESNKIKTPGTKKHIRKNIRDKYPVENVIYILTTEFHKKNNIYIVGRTKNLNDRLCAYNKTCDHEVVYYKSFGNKKDVIALENLVLYKLSKYREVENRDRFILPTNKDITFFTNIIDRSIDFLSEDASIDNQQTITNNNLNV